MRRGGDIVFERLRTSALQFFNPENIPISDIAVLTFCKVCILLCGQEKHLIQ
jgi:hypothetical protein